MVIELVDDIYGRPFDWGRSDCCTRACDVFKVLFGIDPMEPLRGRYTGPLGASRAIKAAGGWLKMCDDLASRAGLEVGVTTPGALGLVENARGFVLAIQTGHGWAAPVDGGSVIVPRAVRSWGLPWRN